MQAYGVNWGIFVLEENFYRCLNTYFSKFDLVFVD